MTRLLEAQQELRSFYENKTSSGLGQKLKPGKEVVVKLNNFFYRGTMIRRLYPLMFCSCTVSLYDLHFSLVVDSSDVRLLSETEGFESLKTSTQAFTQVDLPAELHSTMTLRGMGWLPPYGIGKWGFITYESTHGV